MLTWVLSVGETSRDHNDPLTNKQKTHGVSKNWKIMQTFSAFKSDNNNTKKPTTSANNIQKNVEVVDFVKKKILYHIISNVHSCVNVWVCVNSCKSVVCVRVCVCKSVCEWRYGESNKTETHFFASGKKVLKRVWNRITYNTDNDKIIDTPLLMFTIKYALKEIHSERKRERERQSTSMWLCSISQITYNCDFDPPNFPHSKLNRTGTVARRLIKVIL